MIHEFQLDSSQFLLQSRYLLKECLQRQRMIPTTVVTEGMPLRLNFDSVHFFLKLIFFLFVCTKLYCNITTSSFGSGQTFHVNFTLFKANMSQRRNYIAKCRLEHGFECNILKLNLVPETRKRWSETHKLIIVHFVTCFINFSSEGKETCELLVMNWLWHDNSVVVRKILGKNSKGMWKWFRVN